MPSSILVLALLALPACAEPTWVFPALFWHSDQAWVSIRISNPDTVPISAKVEVYLQGGQRLDVTPEVRELSPGQTVEIRVDGSVSHSEWEEWSWARVEQLPSAGRSLEVTASIEALRGDEITSFPVRNKVALTHFSNWAQPASVASEKDLFFLNLTGATTELTFCATDVPGRPCGNRDVVIRKIRVGPHEALALTVGYVPKMFFQIRSSRQIDAICGVLKAAAGKTKKFSSESSVSFEDH
jgi:hypothetical protein